MALPKWITPAGDLGTVPELEYYQYLLDAYDPSAGTLVYSLVSGRLPLGIQVVTTGRLQGLPVSELGGDQNVKYTFTIRVKNTTTNGLSDRTFSLIVTNVAPPIIIPKSSNNYLKVEGNGITANIGQIITQDLSGASATVLANVINSRTTTIRYNTTTPFILRSGNIKINGSNVNSYPVSLIPTEYYLGLFLDGTEYTEQLEAIEATPGATLTWTLKNGDLPPGLALSSDGVLTGYFEPIPNPAAGRDPDWDQAAWDYLGWQSSLYAIKKRFTFTVKVTDGTNSDLSTYTLDVYPRSSLTADHDDITVDLVTLGTGVPLTIDTGNKHNPIITTTQANLVPVREGSYFSFKLNAIDLDGDAITWSVPTLVTGAFDEQTSPQYNYVASQLVGGILSSGIFPDVSTTTNNLLNTSVSSLDYTQAYLEPGDTIKVLNASNVWQLGTISSSITVRITGNTLVNAAAGQWLTQASSGANATISDISTTTGNITLTGTVYSGYINTLRPTYQITFNGNIYANVGDYITQTISGANARVTSAVGNAIVGASVANVIYITGNFTNGNAISGSNIAIRGISVARYPTANVKDIYNTTLTANIGEYITQTGYTGNAVVTANIIDDVRIPVTFLSGTFNSLGGNVKIGGIDVGVWINNVQTTSTAFGTAATVGQYITQTSTGANAIVTANVSYGTTIPVRFISNTFTTGSTAGNLALVGSNINAYPTSVLCSTDITATYNDANYFDINGNLTTTVPQINASTLTYSNITSLVSVGVTLGSLATEGTVGFDSINSGFDQGVLDLPSGLSLVEDSGWLIGTLPTQTINQVEYEFQVVASKTDDPTYRDTQLFTLTVLGDLNNRIDWVTPSDLGTIETGKISDLFVYATSALGKTLFYELTAGTYHRLPQGLKLTLGGLISGRTSFEVFSLDQSTTTLDGEATTFDFTYTFTVTAKDLANTISANRTFTLTIRQFDKIPYENLYLKALPSAEQRASFQSLVNDTTIFPLEKIYRHEDPWFGLSTDIKTLFLAGLSPSALEKYTQVASTNHYTKRLTFGDVKTARALDQNFNVKYEVVYVEVQDSNTNSFGQGPADTINLINTIDTPYYDADGNEFTTAYPNSVENMGNVMVNGISYQDKGVLPDWMTSRQTNGRQLGFVRAVVLAYVKPGEGDLVAYRLRQRNFNFNSIDFTVDRYQLDNVYSTNYDLTANAFVTSRETTFDRYPALSSTLTYSTTVDFAVSTAFENINDHYLQDIKDAGGLDGIKNIKDGQTIVFAQQEYTATGSTLVDYTQGWSNSIILWDSNGWAYNTDTSDADTLTPDDPTLTPPNLGPYDYTPGQKWDQANYIPGYNEYTLGTTYTDGTTGFPVNPSDGDLTTVNAIIYHYDADSSLWRLANQRAAVWQINISADNIVTLSLVKATDFYDTVYVRNGFTYGGTNIYFDPLVKSNKTVPNYSIVPQQVRTTYTTFDQNGTRFYDHRDSYVVPEQGDKYIKFTKIGVFT